MRVFVTGTDGYIGTLLAAHLLEQGHDVTGCDTGYYRSGWLYNGIELLPRTTSKDIRHLTRQDLDGHEAVVHLAELSNDPLGQLAPHITDAINHAGSIRLAQLAETAGIERFIYFSSCSVYGASEGAPVTEDGALEPLTAYARCKVLVERDLRAMASDRFSPTILRNATAYGASPRQRFDLVVNNLAGWAWCTGTVRLASDGTPRRPLVHVLDICRATACVLAADRARVHDQVFNVGATAENYKIKDVAEIVAATFPGSTVSFGAQGGDRRDYEVDFGKIAAELGFSCRWDVTRGARQLRDLFTRIRLTRELFEAAPYTRLRQIEHLLATEQIDPDFFWRPAAAA